MQTLIGLTIVETNQDYSWLPKKLKKELDVLKFWRMLRGSYKWCSSTSEVVEERGGKPMTAGDYLYATRYAMSCSHLILSKTVTAGFNEEGEMSFKTFGSRNPTEESLQELKRNVGL